MGRAALVALGVVLCSVARAEPPAATAAKLFAAGRAELVDANDPRRACELFAQALALDPTAAGTMLNLGLCNEELGKLHTALSWFRKAQARASETNLPECEQAARDHTAKLAGEVAIVHVALDGAGATAAMVTLDGDVLHATDFGRVEIDPGPHELVARARGYHTARVRFTVTGRGGQSLALRLVPGDDTVVLDPGRARRRAALYAAIGGGVLVLGSGVIGWDERRIADHDAPAAMAGDARAAQATENARWTARYWGTGLFVGGTLALGAAAYLYFTAPAKEKVERVVIAPAIGPTQLGLAARGWF